MNLERALIRSAYFTDHKTKITAVAVELESSEVEGTSIFESTDTYGKMWLDAVRRTILIAANNTKPIAAFNVNLVTGQPECATLSKKVERIFIKVLESKKEINKERIHKIVAADGNHRCHPNDSLYTDLVALLWECKLKFAHFSFEQHHKPSPASAKVFNAARTMVNSKKAPL